MKTFDTTPHKLCRHCNGTGHLPVTDRESEVYTLLGQGLATKEIAAHLHLSIKTIETYIAHLKKAYNLSDTAALRHHAIRRAVELELEQKARTTAEAA